MKLQKNIFPLSNNVKLVFRTLSYRNYRLFFIGNGLSMIGNWMQQIAISWLVYRLTGSSLLLGIVAFAGLFPGFILMPLAGVLTDRWNRRHILLVSQILATLQALALTFLVMTNMINVWNILLLSVFFGFISAFDIPARQSFVVDLIGKREDLGSAIALNSAMFNCARLIGPSLAGVTIAVVGEGICFFLNALTYSAFIATIILVKVEHSPNTGGDTDIFSVFKAGFKYAFGFLPVRALLLLLGLVGLMGMPYAVLLPVFAKDIFHGGPHTLGFLMAAAGVGGVTAALYLASRTTVLGMGRLVPISACIFGLGLMLFSISRIFWISFCLLIPVGFGMMVHLALTNTILQTVVEDGMRGRVMSFFAMAFMGTVPFGSLMAGWLADSIGVTWTLMIGGLCCVLASLAYTRQLPLIREMVRPVYVKMGIISS